MQSFNSWDKTESYSSTKEKAQTKKCNTISNWTSKRSPEGMAGNYMEGRIGDKIHTLMAGTEAPT